MNDETFCFVDDVRQKKIAGNGYHHKVSKRGCKLPSDYLSKKEIMNMSSECISYNPISPMSFNEFRKLSKSEQEEKLKAWSDYYHISGIRCFSILLNVSKNTLASHLKNKSISYPMGTAGDNRKIRDAKARISLIAAAYYGENTPEEIKTPNIVEEVPELRSVPFASHKTQFQTEGVFGSADMKTLLQGISMLVREGKEYNLSISFEEK